MSTTHPIEARAMTDAEFEEALEFAQVRDDTAQWEVKYGGDLIARVTERVVAAPPYSVTLIRKSVDGLTLLFETRDEVMARLIKHAKTF